MCIFQSYTLMIEQTDNQYYKYNLCKRHLIVSCSCSTRTKYPGTSTSLRFSYVTLQIHILPILVSDTDEGILQLYLK